jgi:hypothetical protein
MCIYIVRAILERGQPMARPALERVVATNRFPGDP